MSPARKKASRPVGASLHDGDWLEACFPSRDFLLAQTDSIGSDRRWIAAQEVSWTTRRVIRISNLPRRRAGRVIVVSLGITTRVRTEAASNTANHPLAQAATTSATGRTAATATSTTTARATTVATATVATATAATRIARAIATTSVVATTTRATRLHRGAAGTGNPTTRLAIAGPHQAATRTPGRSQSNDGHK